MRLRNYIFASLFLGGCGTASPDTATGPNGTGGTGGSIEPPPAPTKLSNDAVMIAGVTADDQIIYRDAKALVAIKLDGSEAQPRLITEKAGTVQIRGNVVFIFTDVDWTTGLGELLVWTASTGPRSVGTAIHGDDTALATADGAWVAYLSNVTDTTADLVVSTPDLATRHVVLPALGRGSEETCRAVYGFVGNSLFAAWCNVGTREATLQRFDTPDFVPQTLASGVSTLWSTDETGQRVFYTDPSSVGWVLEGGAPVKVDNSVGWAALVPDGSAVLYTVGDQLRRSSLPGVAPTPVVATQYAARAAFSPSYAYSLYSTTVTYENGTRRDLWITPTAAFNPSPIQLIGEPKAEISRSAFTQDGKWAIYMVDTDIAAGKKAMHVQSVDGGTPIVIENADTAVAATGSRIVFSANRSDPQQYPVLADLMVMDPTLSEPVLMQSGTTDGRGFYLNTDMSKLVYVMPTTADAVGGLYVQQVP